LFTTETQTRGKLNRIFVRIKLVAVSVCIWFSQLNDYLDRPKNYQMLCGLFGHFANGVKAFEHLLFTWC